MPAQPFIGDIMMFAGNFPPLGWATCDGQLLSIAEFDALFALIGTTYGGDGQQTFALPDFRGRIPIHVGNGHALGQAGGVEAVTLLNSQIPAHAHVLMASTDGAVAGTPAAGNAVAGTSGANSTPIYGPGPPTMPMAPNAVGTAGAGQPHSNMAPYTCITFCIAWAGIFPSQ